MEIHQIQPEATKIVSTFTTSMTKLSLNGLVARSIDHFAIKLQDGQHFDAFMRAIEPQCSMLFYTIIGNRRLGGAILNKPVNFGILGTCNHVEIMEPKPAKVGKDFVGLEHIELIHKNLDELAQLFTENQIVFTDRRQGCGSLAIKLDDKGHEVKFRTTPLIDKVTEEYDEGTAIRLKS